MTDRRAYASLVKGYHQLQFGIEPHDHLDYCVAMLAESSLTPEVAAQRIYEHLEHAANVAKQQEERDMTETRAEKAQRLVDEKGVDIIGQSEYGTHAVVKGTDGYHGTALYPNNHFWCSCPWGQSHSHADDLCVHALAVKLAVEKEGNDDIP